MRSTWLLLGVLALGAAQAPAAEPFAFKDGDRVVLLGNTLIEREQRGGYWETLLTARHPDRTVTFRNLGWSGDTVWGDARARFGGRADGFKHLKTHVEALKPTVIIVAYGTNEAFAGKDGLPAFEAGLKTLLDTLDQTKARIVLLAPLKHEKLDPPLPDPKEVNDKLALYRDVLKKTADKRGYGFLDLYALLDRDAGFKCPEKLTDNGMHLTDYGYWRSLSALGQGLPKKSRPAFGLANDKPSGAFEHTLSWLPVPFAPKNEAGERVLDGDAPEITISGLRPGKYTISIDGKPVTTATADQLAKGVALTGGPDFEQAEKLRELILEKNRLYFHRWRPQNETYLFGFRKHEQGQNAREIPQFDPFVEKLEKEIARLRVPVAHKYEYKLEGQR